MDRDKVLVVHEWNHDCCCWIRSGDLGYHHGWIWIGCQMYQQDCCLIQDCWKSDCCWAHLRSAGVSRKPPFLLTALAPSDKGCCLREAQSITRTGLMKLQYWVWRELSLSRGLKDLTGIWRCGIYCIAIGRWTDEPNRVCNYLTIKTVISTNPSRVQEVVRTDGSLRNPHNPKSWTHLYTIL